MKTIPYDTGKVKIGCNYTPPKRVYEPSRTEAMLQRALLNGKSGIDRDGLLIVVGVVALMAAPFLYSWVKL